MNPPGSSRARLSGTRPPGTHDETAASREVREMFSRIAPRYDLLNHLLSLRFDVMWRKRLARRFAHILARPDARVLDVCCGTGDLALALANAPIGVFIAFLVSGILYAGLSRALRAGRRAGIAPTEAIAR